MGSVTRGKGASVPWLIAASSEADSFTFGINKFARNPDIDAAAAEDLWNGGGIWVAPTAARTHAIVSSSAEDGAGTLTGALTIRLYGLDSNYDPAEETVTMNGLTNVNTARAYWMLHRARVMTAGSSGNNVGTITATAAVDNTVTFSMAATYNHTLLGVYQIPTGCKGYILSYGGALNNPPVSTYVAIKLLVQPKGQTFYTRHLMGLTDTGVSSGRHDFNLPFLMDPLDTIKLQASSTQNNTEVTGHFEVLVERG